MESLKFKQKCFKHPNEKIEYIKIHNLENSSSNPFFCCLYCINQDHSIKLEDYQAIKYIMKSNPNQILQKWPPIQNQGIIDRLIEKSNGKSSNNNMVEQVISFFSDFKKQVIEAIDLQQKQMIQIAESIPDVINKSQIIKKYQEISKIEEIKKELLNSNSSINEKEMICKELIQNSKSQQNTQLLQSLLDNLSPKTIFDSQYPLLQQQSILNSIKNINFFKQMIDVKLMKTDREDGQRCLEISQNTNNQPYVINRLNNQKYHNAVSDIILDKKQKYIFRFQIDNLKNNNYFCIGLISDKNKHTTLVYQENLGCEFKQTDQQISKINNSGIDKFLKKQDFILSESRQIEMRICIQEKTLELLDYPEYQYQIGLADQYISNLLNENDLRVCVGLQYENNKITLIDSMIVKQFE